jgi:hypothetical protein
LVERNKEGAFPLYGRNRRLRIAHWPDKLTIRKCHDFRHFPTSRIPTSYNFTTPTHHQVSNAIHYLQVFGGNIGSQARECTPKITREAGQDVFSSKTH